MSTGSKIRYNCRSTNLLLFVLLWFPYTFGAYALVWHKNSFWKTIFCQRFQQVLTSYSCSLKSHIWRKAPTHSQPHARRRCWSTPHAICYTPEKTMYPLYKRQGEFRGRSGQHRKSNPHQDSISGPSSPERIAIPTELTRQLVSNSKPINLYHLLVTFTSLDTSGSRADTDLMAGPFDSRRRQYNFLSVGLSTSSLTVVLTESSINGQRD